MTKTVANILTVVILVFCVIFLVIVVELLFELCGIPTWGLYWRISYLLNPEP